LRARIDNTSSTCGASCVATAAADLLRPQPQCPQHWLAPLLALWQQQRRLVLADVLVATRDASVPGWAIGIGTPTKLATKPHSASSAIARRPAAELRIRHLRNMSHSVIRPLLPLN
jgi:hypothetical protein